MTSRITLLQAAFNDFEDRLEATAQARSAFHAAPPVPSAQTPFTQSQAKSQAVGPHSESSPPAPQQLATGAMDLYQSAMQHYASKDFEFAGAEFSKYLKTDRTSENAINAQFYMAEIEYQDKDFEGALEDYTSVSMRLSDPAKAAHAQYKKALCLVEVDRRVEAIIELQALIERYPHSAEAAHATKKLRTLGHIRAIHH